jgi:hypothetical protein
MRQRNIFGFVKSILKGALRIAPRRGYLGVTRLEEVAADRRKSLPAFVG